MSNIFGLFSGRNNDDGDPNATENYSGGQSSGMAVRHIHYDPKQRHTEFKLQSFRRWLFSFQILLF